MNGLIKWLYKRAGVVPLATADKMIEHVAAERDALLAAGAWCEKHKPNGGARSVCVVCSGEKLSAALSRISYLCGEPNEMGCGVYDAFPDEDAVVAQVEHLKAELAGMTASYELADKMMHKFGAERDALSRDLRLANIKLKDRQHPSSEPRDTPEALAALGFWPDCGCGECYAIHCLSNALKENAALKAECKKL